MNKIIIDRDNYILDIYENSFIEIKINSKIKINLLNDDLSLIMFSKNNNIEVNFEIKDNQKLVINSLGIDSSINYNIVVHNNNYLYITESILTNKDSINNINIKELGNNSNTYFYTNGINLSNNKLYFNINGIVNKKCFNINLVENSKIINIKDGDSKIIPNLIIDSKEVIANHSAFIGTFNKDDLIYLMSRGINNNNAKHLLMKSILLSKINLDKDIFVDIINNFL